jgi:hypothetical protein
MATTIKKISPKPLPVQLTAKTFKAPSGDEVLETKGPQVTKVKNLPKEYDDNGKVISEAPTAIAKQAVALISKKFKDGSEVDSQVPVGDLQTFTAPHATVGLSMAVTRNLGNYESVKMSVSLFMPCENNETAMQETFDEVKGWVDTRVELLNQEVNAQLA